MEMQITRKQMVVYPFMHAQLQVSNAVANELSETSDRNRVYGIVPRSLPISNQDLSVILNRPCPSRVTPISICDLDKFGREYLFVRTRGDGSPQCNEFANHIDRILAQKGIKPFTLLDFWTPPLDMPISIEDTALNLHHTAPIDGQRLMDVPVPVIGVGAIYESYCTAEIVSVIKKTFRNKIKVSTIYAQDDICYSSLNCIPVSFLKRLSFEDRLFYINWFARDVVSKEQPDILVVEIPGGLLKIDDQNLNGAGEYPYIYSQALDFDYFICSNVFNNAQGSTTIITNVADYLHHRYGFNNVAIHISNMMFVPAGGRGPSKSPYIFGDMELVSEYIKNMIRFEQNTSEKSYNFFEEQEVWRWYENICKNSYSLDN